MATRGPGGQQILTGGAARQALLDGGARRIRGRNGREFISYPQNPGAGIDGWAVQPVTITDASGNRVKVVDPRFPLAVVQTPPTSAPPPLPPTRPVPPVPPTPSVTTPSQPTFERPADINGLPVFKAGVNGPDERGNGSPGDLWWGGRWWKPGDLAYFLDRKGEFEGDGTGAVERRKGREMEQEQRNAQLAERIRNQPPKEMITEGQTEREKQAKLKELLEQAKALGHDDIVKELANSTRSDGIIDGVKLETAAARLKARMEEE